MRCTGALLAAATFLASLEAVFWSVAIARVSYAEQSHITHTQQVHAVCNQQPSHPAAPTCGTSSRAGQSGGSATGQNPTCSAVEYRKPHSESL